MGHQVSLRASVVLRLISIGDSTLAVVSTYMCDGLESVVDMEVLSGQTMSFGSQLVQAGCEQLIGVLLQEGCSQLHWAAAWGLFMFRD